MRIVEPQVFLIGEPRVLWDGPDGLHAYLEAVGAPNWVTDAATDIGTIIEVMGRMCYRSFEPGLNPNVVKVRREHRGYIRNILRLAHGSVIEHGQLSFIFFNVARVFTHELVRHRAGVAISQESLRFVRLDDLPFWLPTVIRESPEAMEVFTRVARVIEEGQREIAHIFDLDNPEKKMTEKKIATSAMRRVGPMGVGTTIGWSANLRTIRWVLQMRTEESAEEEIRLVFHKLGELVRPRFRPFFDDFRRYKVKGSNIPRWVPAYKKV